jgi:hypothetical protein
MAANDHRHAAEIARDCMASRVRRLERLLTRIYDDAIRPHGLTGSQLELLVALQLIGKTTAAAVGRRLELEKSTVSRNLARLVAAAERPRSPPVMRRGERLNSKRARRFIPRKAG